MSSFLQRKKLKPIDIFRQHINIKHRTDAGVGLNLCYEMKAKEVGYKTT